MTRDNILDMMNGARDNYVMAAIESRNRTAQRGLGRKRLLLMAAIVAVTALLAGCVAAYFWMQDMAVGSDTYIKYHDEQGLALSEPVEIQLQVVTFAGYTGSNSNKAFSEWYAFRESYDPEGKYATNNPDIGDIENNYEWVYGCYTRELVDKLDEIVAKYGMKLLDVWIPVQAWQSDVALQQGLGRSTLLKPDAQAKMGNVQGMLYPPYNFKLNYELRLTGEDAAWTKPVWVDEYYYHRDYLPSNGTWHLDMESFDQWNYTTADGVELLLAMNKTGLGFIIAEQEEVFQVAAITGNRTATQYPTPDQVPGKEALEQMAEAIDFGITVGPIDAVAMEPAMEAAEAEHQASQVYEDPVYTGFEDWMKQKAPWWADDYAYTFYDINHDGEEELLIGFTEGDYAGAIDRYLSMENGQVKERFLSYFLCEGDVYESSHPWTDHSTQYVWSFYHYPDENRENNSSLGQVIRYSDGTWTLSEVDGLHKAQEVTQAEAEAFLAQFKRVELDWKPIKDYPMAGAGTVGDWLDSLNVPVSKEELHQLYADFCAERGDDWYTHYRIMDVNDDGVDDLILSHDGEKSWQTYTYRYGHIDAEWPSIVYYCQGNVWERVDIYRPDLGTEIEQHEFYKHTGEETVSVGYAAYNKATASWQSDLDGTPMTSADAESLLAKYPRLDLGLRPIEELIANSGK